MLVGILTVSGYFQLFAEPYVMTQGGPLRSTFSMLYLMYEEGFRWWNLGNASAVAFLLFVVIFCVSWLMLRFDRDAPRPAMKPRLRRLARQRPARRAGRVQPVSAAVDGLGLVHAAGRLERAADADPAAVARRSRTTAPCSAASAWAATCSTAC